MEPRPIRPETDPNELRAFLLVLRQAFLMITRYIEKRYIG